MKNKVKLDSKKRIDTVSINSLSHDGRGIAIVENKKTFISGALPNETVVYEMTQKRTQFNEGKALTILQPSQKDRVQPPCEHFGLCGGCSLQHMHMDTQLALKQQTLLDQLKHFGKVAPLQILPPLCGSTLGYRRKARLGVKFVIKKNKVLVGFREKKSNYLADISHCPVLHPMIGERLLDLSTLIASLKSYRHIPQIEIAVGDDEAALVFRHMELLTECDQAKLIAFAKDEFQLYLQPNPPAPIHKIWPQDGEERLSYTLPDYQLKFLFHPLDFTQVNLAMNRLMVKQALDLLDIQPNERVLDLFSGIGNFTLPIARLAKEAVGVEGDSEMVGRARQNAHYNNIQNAAFYVGNLMTPSSADPWFKAYDKILLDPPRAGAQALLPYFKQFAPKRILYVSCNPATLARDAGELVHEHGYLLTSAGTMNMFPHTSHIEAMAVFEKK